jgi:cytochrome c oxidase subunit 4
VIGLIRQLSYASSLQCSKALLVIFYFMHLKYITRLTSAVVAGSFYWLGILFVLTMGDYLPEASVMSHK